MTEEILDPRETYTAEIYNTAFRSLPHPKRVWQDSETESSLGKLLLLTPAVVSSAAATEIKTGRRVGLGWNLTKLENSQFGRQSCAHKMIPLTGGAYFDDAISFNPQSSSQWDGFRHASQPRDLDKHGLGKENLEDRVFFGGVTKEDIFNVENTDIGIHHWAREGIAGAAMSRCALALCSIHVTTTLAYSHAENPNGLLPMVQQYNIMAPKYCTVKGDHFNFQQSLHFPLHPILRVQVESSTSRF